MGLFSEKCVQCGSRVKKGAEYCSECGEPRKGAWRKCHDCGASVGAQSKSCWKCKADLTSQPTAELFGDRWRRSESDFAVRFPLRTPDGIVKHGIQVDDGTQAFLYVNGKYDKTMGPGYHVMSSFFERLTKMEKSQHAAAVLVSTGPAMVSIDVDGLHDAEQVPLGAVMKLELELGGPDKFAERVMLGRDTVGNEEIRDLVIDELREVVQKRAATYQIEDLLVDVSQREGLEAVLGREMRRILEPYGLAFRAVRLARFTGEGVEAIRERLGEKAIATRQYEIDREMQAMHRTNRLKSIETEYEFNEVEKQLAHDYALKDSERELFRVRWEEETGHTLTLERLERTKEVRAKERQEELSDLRHEAAKAGAEEDVKDVKFDAELGRGSRASDEERRQDEKDLDLAGKANQGAVEKLKAMQELELAKKKAELDLRLTERKGMAEVDFDELRVRKEVMRGMSRDELIAITGSAELADRYVRLEQIQAGQKPSFTPSQFNQEHKGLGGGGFGGVTPGMLPPSGVPNVAGAPVVSVGGASVGASEDQKLQDVARHMMSAVGLISVTDSDGDGAGFGTGWMVGPRVLATNAHVAADAIEAMKQGMSCWVTFGGPDGPRKARVERSVMHPKYGDPGPGPDGGKCAVPSYDVAMLVLDSDQPNVFQVAPMEKLVRMVEQRVGTRVAYLGFPMEDLAGGGASKSNPAAVMKSGIVSQVTDWWLGSTSAYQQATLIQHDLGVAGGASGSPLFDADGHVLGLVSAGNMAAGIDVTSGKVKRIPSGVMLNFAQRVDLLGELLATPEGY